MISFPSSFQRFSPKFGESVSDNHAKRKCRGFLLLSPFKTYDYFSEENACVINVQSLTASQKQARQVITVSH